MNLNAGKGGGEGTPAGGGEYPGLVPGMVRLASLLVGLRNLKHTGASPVDRQPSSHTTSHTNFTNGESPGLVPGMVRLVLQLVGLGSLKHTGASLVDRQPEHPTTVRHDQQFPLHPPPAGVARRGGDVHR